MLDVHSMTPTSAVCSSLLRGHIRFCTSRARDGYPGYLGYFCDRPIMQAEELYFL